MSEHVRVSMQTCEDSPFLVVGVESTLTVKNASSSEVVFKVVYLPCPAVMHLPSCLDTFPRSPERAREIKTNLPNHRPSPSPYPKLKQRRYETVLFSRVQTASFHFPSRGHICTESWCLPLSAYRDALHGRQSQKLRVGELS